MLRRCPAVRLSTPSLRLHCGRRGRARRPRRARAAAADIADLRQPDAGAGAYRYAEGKWSVKEVIGHLADAERVFSYRLLRIARGDQTPLAGFDENTYVAGVACRRAGDWPIW